MENDTIGKTLKNNYNFVDDKANTYYYKANKEKMFSAISNI